MNDTQHATHARSKRYFVQHFVEMVVAMVVGMIALGPLWTMAFAALGLPRLHDLTELHALVMATNMTIGMSAWMRFRGCRWPAIWEMALAMYVPFVALFPLLWAGWLAEGALLTLGHVLMLPAMLLAMLRRKEEYLHSHRHHRAAAQPAVVPDPALGRDPA